MFTHAVRKQMKDCVMEARIKRLSRLETQALIQSRTGHTVTIFYIDYLIKIIKKHAPARLAELQKSKDAFLDLQFQTYDEIERYMTELWRIFHLSEHDRYLQVNCIDKLHHLTISRANILEVIPYFANIGGDKEPNEASIHPNLAPTQGRRDQAVF